MNKLEKFLSKKISLWILFLTIIISIIFAIFFGSVVLRSKTAANITRIPENFVKILTRSGEFDLSIKEKRFGKDNGLIFNQKKFDLNSKFLLLARYDGDINRSVVELIDLNKREKIHTWRPNINKMNSFSKLSKQITNLSRDHNSKRYQMTHPILLENGDLVIKGDDTPLTKIDICSKIVWSLDHVFHHSTETEGNNYWVPITFFPSTVQHNIDEHLNNTERIFRDDGIMKVSNEGKVLFKKSVIKIFLENNLQHLLYDGLNPSDDPIHINDIQPVLYNGKYFLAGDLFLSLRHLSMVVLYRPSTNKIIWYKKFPWVLQHDVDILNDHQISVYNNKRLGNGLGKNGDNNNVLIYDFKNKKIINKYKALFKNYNIRAPFEGLSEILSDGSILIEEGVFGRLMYFDSAGDLILKYINRSKNNKLYRLNWSRIISIDDKEILEKFKDLDCEK